ncbi:hypothetical protein HOY82DRAFT_613282 [Tuber indicum]|nr:hypothetical protein HOY82DRAFT_613282 [Tuber indicum]
MAGLDWQGHEFLWPDYDYRREFVRCLSDYILDKSGRYATVEPGTWYPGVPLPPKVHSDFSNCVRQFVESLFDGPFQGHQPLQEFGVGNYAMERYLHGSNEEPFNTMAVTMPREVNNFAILDEFDSQSPSTAGDPRRPIRDLHRQGAVQTDFFPMTLGSDVFPRGTHGADLAEQVETLTTEIMSSRKSHVEQLAPPLPQFTTLGSHDPGRPRGSALGRRRRAYSGEESTSAGSQTATRRTKTKRDQLPLKTVAGEEGQSSRSFGANARSVDESPRNTTSVGTVSKEGFKHKCDLCGERFEFPARLKSHMETITHAERRYRCMLCGSVFSRKSSLKRHQEAATACKSKAQSGNDSPPPSTPESGARNATFHSARSARPPSMASPSHGNVSPSIPGNQSVSSQNQFRQYSPASAPRASFGGVSYLPPMPRTSSQQYRPPPPSVASRSSYRPPSARSYIDPRVLDGMSGGHNDCDQIRTGNGCGT